MISSWISHMCHDDQMASFKVSSSDQATSHHSQMYGRLAMGFKPGISQCLISLFMDNRWHLDQQLPDHDISQLWFLFVCSLRWSVYNRTLFVDIVNVKWSGYDIKISWVLHFWIYDEWVNYHLKHVTNSYCFMIQWTFTHSSLIVSFGSDLRWGWSNLLSLSFSSITVISLGLFLFLDSLST